MYDVDEYYCETIIFFFFKGKFIPTKHFYTLLVMIIDGLFVLQNFSAVQFFYLRSTST